MGGKCICVSVFEQLCQNWNIKLFRGRPATHVSPEGEETSHHTGGKEKGRVREEKERKGSGKVSRQLLYC